MEPAERLTPFLLNLFGCFDAALSDELTALSVKQHDVIAREIDINLFADGEHGAAENNAGEQEIINAYLDGGFHTGGHCAVNLAAENAVIGDGDKLGANTENEILVGDNRVILNREIVFNYLCDMVAEGLILVALFNVALFLCGFCQLCGSGCLVIVAGLEPLGHVDSGIGNEFDLLIIENGEREAAVSTLGALSFNKVYRGVADEIGNKEIIGAAVNGEGSIILLENTVIDKAYLGSEGHSLHLVMGNVNKGGACFNMKSLQLVSHLKAELCIKVGERLIHEENGGLGSEGSSNSNTLLLTARKLCGVSIHEHTYLNDTGNAANREVYLFLGELSHFGDYLAVSGSLKVIVEVLRLFSGCYLGFESGYLGGHILTVFNMVAEQLLGGEHRDGESVYQLDVGFLFIQLALLVTAFLDYLGDLVGGLENFSETSGVLCLKINFGHLLLDVGETESDVVINGHVGPEGVVLEKEADLALVGGDVDSEVAVENDLIADGDAAAGGSFQTCYHSQGGGLSAAGGTEQSNESVIFYNEVKVINSIELAPAFCDVFQFYLRHSLTSYSLVKACAGCFVNQSVAYEDSDYQDKVDAAGEGVKSHLIEVIEGGGKDKALNAQQHEERKLSQTGHKRQQIAADDRSLLNGDNDAEHSLHPGDILDYRGFFYLARKLKHRVERVSACKRDIFYRAYDDEDRIGVEEVYVLIGEQDEESGAYCDRGHEIGQESYAVYIVCPFASSVFGNGIAYHGADGARQKRAANAYPDGSAKGAPDGLVVEDAHLTIHTVFGDVLAGYPPFCGEVGGIARVKEGIISRVGQEGLKCEGNDGEYAGEEGENNEDECDNIFAGFAEVDFGYLTRFAGNGGVVFAALQAELI